MKIDSLLDIDRVSVSSDSSVYLLLRLVSESTSEVQNLPQRICIDPEDLLVGGGFAADARE